MRAWGDLEVGGDEGRAPGLVAPLVCTCGACNESERGTLYVCNEVRYKAQQGVKSVYSGLECTLWMCMHMCVSVLLFVCIYYFKYASVYVLVCTMYMHVSKCTLDVSRCTYNIALHSPHCVT